MGVRGIEEWNSMEVYIPSHPVNYDLMNKCYLIIHDPNEHKRSHMSILIDIGGNSTSTTVVGLLLHVTANSNDGLIPHSTALRDDIWKSDNDNEDLIYLWNLSNSRYLSNPHAMPPYLFNSPVMDNLCSMVSNTQMDTRWKKGLLWMLASSVYANMLINDREIWSSTINCQQFARRFVIEGLGLEWPNNIQVVGDLLPISIDIGIHLISKSNKITRKRP